MKLVPLAAGTFTMGTSEGSLRSETLPDFGNRSGGRMDFLRHGDFDERPVHRVTISTPFHMATTEVTNYQYELFDPRHRTLRGKHGLSSDDDEPVIYVNWYEAQAFCEWLSDKEGRAYRLPTEAEWEYACRAGTTTAFSTGDFLDGAFHRNQKRTGLAVPVALHVGKTPANPWGLFDLHGGVEEWCIDGYGPYLAKPQVDPVGYAAADFRVTRGGSHGTPIYYLRSANRLGAPPEDRHWMLGFRVVVAEAPATLPLAPPEPPLHQRNVLRRPLDEVQAGPSPENPYFLGPRRFVQVRREARGPVFASHNHFPAVVECPNGDLLSVWYTCVSEYDRELGLAASRLRHGTNSWEPAEPFFDVPDRNDHGHALWYDDEETIYHLVGISSSATWYPLALAMRTSRDSGATWSQTRLVLPEHGYGHLPSEPMFRRRDGTIVLGCDYRSGLLWMTKDHGLTWTNPGGVLKGIHVAVTELNDGSLLAYSRNSNVDGRMARVTSTDSGKSWQYAKSDFPPVDTGRRCVLLRLREGPLFFASFAPEPMPIRDATGVEREIRGLYAAVSFDEGKTWPHRRPVTHDGAPTAVECLDGELFALSERDAEFRGYLTVCQSLDGVIHLLSSRQHYAFNLKWATTPAPAVKHPPLQIQAATETFSGPDFDLPGWSDYKGFEGTFTAKGQFNIHADAYLAGINRLVGKGSFEMEATANRIAHHPAGPKADPGLRLGFRDGVSRSFFVGVDENELRLELRDRQAPEAASRDSTLQIGEKIESVRVKLTWDETTRRLRAFYGTNGEPAQTEFPESASGLHFQSPLRESTAAHLLMSNGDVELEHFELRPRT